MTDYPAVHKSLEYAYPTSQNATDHGFGKTGCYLVSTYTYINAVEGYNREIKHASEDRSDAIAFWQSLDLPVNMWSCQSVRHPEWIIKTA